MTTEELTGDFVEKILEDLEATIETSENKEVQILSLQYFQPLVKYDLPALPSRKLNSCICHA